VKVERCSSAKYLIRSAEDEGGSKQLQAAIITRLVAEEAVQEGELMWRSLVKHIPNSFKLQSVATGRMDLFLPPSKRWLSRRGSESRQGRPNMFRRWLAAAILSILLLGPSLAANCVGQAADGGIQEVLLNQSQEALRPWRSAGGDSISPYKGDHGSTMHPSSPDLEIDSHQHVAVRLGVLANRGKGICRLEWNATANYLATQLSPRRFEIVPLDFEEVQNAAEQRSVEFLLVNPSMYVALEYHGLVYRIATFLQPSVKGESPPPVFGGVIFSRADRNDIRELRDFVGKRFAAVSPNSMGGWHAAWREFERAGIHPPKDFALLVFSGTHDTVVEAVRSGQVDGGTVRSTQLERMALEGAIELKDFRILPSPSPPSSEYPFLLSTRLYPEWPFAAVKGTDLELGKLVASALLRMEAGDMAAKAARGAGWAIPQDYTSLHECLRELQLPPYEYYGKVTPAQAVAQYWGFILSALGVAVTILGLTFMTWRRGARLKNSLIALRANAEKMDSIFRAAPTGIGVTVDRTIWEANDRLCQMTGYTQEELVGRNARLLYPSDDEYDYVGREKYKEIAEKGTGTLETCWRRKNGDLINVLLSSTPIHPDEHSLGITFSALDITSRKRVEEELRKEEHKYRALFEGANDGIFLHGPQGFVDCNEKGARMYGLKREELIGRSPAELCPERQSDGRLSSQVAAEKIELAFNGEPQSFEWQYLRADGVPFDAEITLNRVEMGGTFLLQAIVRDITERKQAEEERQRLEERLQRAEKMEALGTLAGGVAHDLNNVLGIVIGYSELLINDLGESSSASSDAEEILKGGKRAAAIVEDLLTLARRGIQSRKVVNLNDILLECRKSPGFANVFSYHPNITIKTDIEADLLNILGSSVHLEKSFINLVYNAAEAMPGGGSLTIRTRSQYLDRPVLGYDEVKEGDYVVLSVSDTGEGIPGSDLKRIFEPFYTKKVMGRSGTGLGLAVVWGTVKDHHGYINVESKVGKGTTFTLYFPVTREEIDSEKVSVSLSEFMGKGEIILVIDDVQEQRDLAMKILTKLSYRVSTASSGEEAVEYLEQHSVDLVVLDMIMHPGMDGLDTYMEILKICPEQKAIIVSGFSETERVMRAQKLGAGSYVKKPYVLEKLGLAVRRELDRTHDQGSITEALP
jgi:PAS domain S-box-containing protein